MATLENQEQSYSASDIQVLEGMEAVRRRPGMYIGSTDQRGIHQLIYEAVDNSVDEYMAGHCTSVQVDIDSDGVVVVEDNGRGIPVDVHKKTKVSGLETVMTTLHAGGKFDSDAYQVSGGLHGVGISVVNALSSFLNVDVYRDAKHYEQKFSRGKTTSDLSDEDISKEDKKATGTKVSFKPDSEIFPDIDYDFSILSQRFKEIAYLNKGLKISFKSNWGVSDLTQGEILDDDDDDVAEDQQMDLFADQEPKKDEIREVEYFFEGGISQFVSDLNSSRIALHENPIYVEKEIEGTIVEVALQY
ncbi:MAG: ATP-binding protein, partial [Dehalococcoidia bacterium]